MTPRLQCSVRLRRGARGFTLIEVMVALIIIAVGMLGIAKLQGLALANTGVASMRSMAAMQTTSLAAAMHANRAFWAANTAPSFVNDNSTGANTFTPTGTLVLGTAASCQNVHCAPGALAGYDVYEWIQSINATLPYAKETVSCSDAAQPVACTIQVEWTEGMVGANAQTAQVAAANQQSGTNATQSITHPTYELYVVP